MQPINETGVWNFIGALRLWFQADGERYELQLCEKCFFYALATLIKERADEFMFDENFDPSTLDGFGLK